MSARLGLLNPKNAVVSTNAGGKFQEGLGLITDRYFEVWKPDDPKPREGDRPRVDDQGNAIVPEGREKALFMTFEVTMLDQNLKPMLIEDEAVRHTYRLKMGNVLRFLHPGNSNSAQDDEIEDAGDQPGAKGPTLKAVKALNDDGSEVQLKGLHEKCAAMVFMHSLAECNIEPSILDSHWGPDLIGGIFEFKVVKSDVMFPKDKPPTYKDKNGVEKSNPYDILTVARIVEKPTGSLDNKKGKKGADTKVPSAPVSAGGTAPAATATNTAPAQAASGSPEDIATNLVAELVDSSTAIGAKVAGQKVSKKAFVADLSSELTARAVSPTVKAQILANYLKNDAWIGNKSTQFGFQVVTDANGKVTEIQFADAD